MKVQHAQREAYIKSQAPALLSGRLFDVAGNRMSPTHANKGGVRYRYYASQAVLQKKPQAPRSEQSAELEGLLQLGAVRALAALDLDKFLHEGGRSSHATRPRRRGNRALPNIAKCPSWRKLTC
jgi:hypothetical protein